MGYGLWEEHQSCPSVSKSWSLRDGEMDSSSSLPEAHSPQPTAYSRSAAYVQLIAAFAVRIAAAALGNLLLFRRLFLRIGSRRQLPGSTAVGITILCVSMLFGLSDAGRLFGSLFGLNRAPLLDIALTGD